MVAGSLENRIEIMAPAGSYESLMAAIQGGAHSVYFGVGKLNMRSRSSKNFSLDDLEKIATICREYGMKSYLALNTIVYDEEMDEVHQTVRIASDAGVSAVIASDVSVMEAARERDMEVHISTQCNITNLAAVKFYSRFADVVVLARELNLEQVRFITDAIKKENICGPSGRQVMVEMFVHGAFCMAVSGKCYLSLDNMNHSANRGACLQLCRRSYLVTDKEEGFEVELDHEYMMSPKDLCTIGFLDQIVHAGVSVLKIEGRGRGPEYVKVVTNCYREAAGDVLNGTYNQEKVEQWKKRLAKVFNRGFWDGYYLGQKVGEWSAQYGSQATHRKLYAGKVTNYFSNIGVAEIKLESHGIAESDELIITGPTTGVVEFLLEEVRVDEQQTPVAQKGQICSVAVPDLVRRGDKLFVWSSRLANFPDD